MAIGLIQSGNAAAMTLFDVPSGAALLHFLQAELAWSTGELISELRFLIVLLGAGVYFLVGLTSVGSGALVAVALTAVSRLPTTSIVGTDTSPMPWCWSAPPPSRTGRLGPSIFRLRPTCSWVPCPA